MFDTSSFRIRYKAPLDKPLLVAFGPLLVAATIAAALLSRFGRPVSLGPWISSDLLALLLPIALIALVALVIERLFGVDEGYPWQRSLAATGAGVVGGTLLVGAWAKLLDPVSFADTLRLEGLTAWIDRLAFSVPVTVAPLAVVTLELLLGALLVLGVRNRTTLIATALLVAFFLFLNGRAYWRDAHGVVVEGAASCGCFGNLLDRTPAQAFWQDAALLVPGLLLALLAPVHRHAMGRRVALAVLVAAAGAGFGWFAPTLPIDDLATRLRPGVEVASICAGSGGDRLCLPTLVPELSEGRHLVVILDLEADGLEPAVASLNDYWLATGDDLPRLWVLAASTPDQSRAFFWKYGPSFEIREAPPSLLRPLYRQLPRSFEVVGGKVVRTWRRLPPFSRWTGAGDGEQAGAGAEAPGAGSKKEA